MAPVHSSIPRVLPPTEGSGPTTCSMALGLSSGKEVSTEGSLSGGKSKGEGSMSGLEALLSPGIGVTIPSKAMVITFRRTAENFVASGRMPL